VRRWPGRRLGGACTLAGVLAVACSGPEAESGFEPTVEVVDGVEIATLPPLPDLLDPDHFWQTETLLEVRTVMPGADEPLLFDPASLVVLSDGALFVHDPSAGRPLVVVDPSTGSVEARFGRKGQGPNELQNILELAEAEDGSLAVFDYGNRRVHRYTRDGSELGEHPVDALLVNGEVMRAPDGQSFLAETMRSSEFYYHDLYRVDFDTGEAERLLSLPDLPAGEEYTWQSGRALWTALAGGVVGMWGGTTEFSRYAEDGSVRRRVRLPLSKRRLTDDDIADIARDAPRAAQSLEPGPMGLTNYLFPVNDSLFGMLTGGMWRAAGDPELPAGVQLWRLFDPDGRYVGVMNSEAVLGRGDGETFWIKELDEHFYPIMREVRLVPGGEMELPELPDGDDL
jgi:hypothetical protein